MSRVFQKRGIDRVRWAGFLWLFCLVWSVFPVFGVSTEIDPDLVFCPLQKIWVHKGGDSARRKVDPLKEICASDSSKGKFSYESFRYLRPGGTEFNDEGAEALFFGYLKEGKAVFERARHQRAPGHGISAAARHESAAGSQPSLERKTTPLLIINGPPIQPGIAQQQRYFRPHAAESKELRRISHPRAPPELIR